MLRRWWFGDVDGHQFPRYGFLGRLCDVIATPDAGHGRVTRVGTVGGARSRERNHTFHGPLQRRPLPCARRPEPRGAVDRRTTSDEPGRSRSATMLFAARKGTRTALRFSDLLTGLPASTVTYPDSGLAAQLTATARLLTAGAGVRIVHVPFGGDFDTHEDHLSRHNTLMTELDGALGAFLQELTSLGLSQSVLVATNSEFVSGTAELERAGSRHRHGRPAYAAPSTPVCTARTPVGASSTRATISSPRSRWASTTPPSHSGSASARARCWPARRHPWPASRSEPAGSPATHAPCRGAP